MATPMPNGRTAAGATVLLFWDYDTQWGADRSRDASRPRDWGALEFGGAERLLELHATFGIPACFAVVGAAALPGARPYHDPAQIRRLHEAGHEIASHSFQHEWLPGFSGAALRELLRMSKDALEQCIGAPVRSFVPPFNQPFDYPARLAFSLSERRQVAGPRTDLPALCEALEMTGYRFCRVCFRPLPLALLDWVVPNRFQQEHHLRRIGGITCARLNTAGGFAAPVVRALERCARSGGILVAYGHPHSLRSGNAQDEQWLVPFLTRLRELRDAGRVRVALPRDLIPE